MKASQSLIKAVEKLNAEINAFAAETGEPLAILYEDANTTRQVGSFKLYKNGVLTWYERTDGKTFAERYDHYDEDDVRDTLKFWRANLRRAKRYWAMDTETLDRIQDGEQDDTEEQ